jgi:hypothetical protein
MNPNELFILQVVTAASPAFAFGLILGWVLALAHQGGSTINAQPRDREE